MEKNYGTILLKFVFVGVLFHAIYLYSIIDIYFQSPLIPVEKNFQNPEDLDHSKRVFFFVFDGATSDDYFLHGARNIRRNIINQGKGRWGISHTRVPTESRPCHVAMFGGFYEDPSSVTTGWSINPVSYDSIIQQSNYSLLIGAADVVELFNNIDHADVFSFPMEMEDFATSNPSFLDEWVEKKFFEKTKTPEILQKLKQDKIFVFLQFEGIDAAGHEYRPDSEGYIKSIQYVDESVWKIVKWVEEFYGYDGKTTFVSATDHGMSKLGTHGGAEYGCTRTPFVAWGANVNLEKLDVPVVLNDGRFATEEEEVKFMMDKWEMSSEIVSQRSDFRQADLSPLISSWLGIPVPVNNIGVLPLNYCCDSKIHQLYSYLSNARQIGEQFKEFEKIKKLGTVMNFSPYKNRGKKLNFTRIGENIRKHKNKHQEIFRILEEFIDWNIDGIKYYQQYHKYFLLGITGVGYSLYIAYLLIYSSETIQDKLSGDVETIAFASHIVRTLFVILCFYMYTNGYPIMGYFYGYFPFMFLMDIIQAISIHEKTRTIEFLKNNIASIIVNVILKIGFAEIMVYGFYERKIFFVGYCILGIQLKSIWVFLMGVFSLFPLNMGISIWLYSIGVILQIGKKMYSHYYCEKKLVKKHLILICILLIGSVNVLIIELASIELPFICRIVSWLLVLVSILFPIFDHYFDKFETSETDIFEERFHTLVLSFSISYCLLTVNYEMIFFFTFSNMLVEWIKGFDVSEFAKRNRNLLFLYFFFSSFFATGNLASFSSFQIPSVLRFVTSLRPFLMASLLLWKLVIPFLITIISLVLILKKQSSKKEWKKLLYLSFLEIVAMCDMMSLTFLFLVKDTGSWLEIGNSISRYAITSMIMIVLLIIYYISLFFVRNVEKQKTE